MKKFGNAFLILTSLTVAYGLAEVFFRIFPPQTTQFSTGQYYFDVTGSVYEFGRKKINVGLKPLSVSSLQTPEYSTQMFINSSGYREREFLYQPDNESFRIIIVGDSITFGKGVEQEERFSRFIESDLVGKFPEKNIEVLNLGVGSYSAGQVRLLLQEETTKLRPDLVIFAHFSNDAMEWAYIPDEAGLPRNYVVSTETWNKIHRSDAKSEPPANSAIPDWAIVWAEYSSVGALIKRFFEKQNKQNNTAYKYKFGDPRNDPFWPLRKNFSPESSDEWSLHLRIVSTMSSFVLGKGIPFLLVSIPCGVQVNGFEWDWGRTTHGFHVGEVRDGIFQKALFPLVKRQGGDTLDLVKYFRDASSQEKRIYFPYDGHLTVHGHRVLADALTPIVANIIRRE